MASRTHGLGGAREGIITITVHRDTVSEEKKGVLDWLLTQHKTQETTVHYILFSTSFLLCCISIEKQSFPSMSLYQSGSAWPHYRGFSNNNTGLSIYQGDHVGSIRWALSSYYFYPTHASPTVAMDGTIYIGITTANGLYALTQTGSLKWTFVTLRYSAVWAAAAIGSDNTIYFGSTDFNFYAVNPSGTMKWSYQTGNAIYSSAAIDSNEVIYVGSFDSNLYAFTSTGTMKWTFKTKNYIYSSPAIDTAGHILFGSSDDKIYSVYSSGSLYWSYTTGSSIFSSPAIGSNGNVYIGSNDYNLYALSVKGSYMWSRNLGGILETSPAVGSDGTIYIGSPNGNLYAISPLGTTMFPYATGSAFDFNGPAIDATGIIYFGTTNGNIYAISNTGGLQWSMNVCSDSFSYSPSIVIGYNGNLYFGGDNSNCDIFFSFFTNPPTFAPTHTPTALPSSKPTTAPSTTPTSMPTVLPSSLPTQIPTFTPTLSPTGQPTFMPSTSLPSVIPTFAPTTLTAFPSSTPSAYPTQVPSSLFPSFNPTFTNTFQRTTAMIIAGSSTTATSFSTTYIGIIVGVVILICIVLFFIYYRLHLAENKRNRSKEISMTHELIYSNNKLGDDVANVNTAPTRFNLYKIAKTYSMTESITPSTSTSGCRVKPIVWNSIQLLTEETTGSFLIGKGSFGSVVKALWRPNTSIWKSNGLEDEQIVAIKIISQTAVGLEVQNNDAFDKLFSAALTEVQTMMAVEDKILFKDCIVKVYGIASGQLPSSLRQALAISEFANVIGIVMRYEGGGSLQTLIYRKDKESNPITMLEKLRLLKLIARGLAGLHAAGVVHADIKPDNILLSDSNPPEIRLADFGLSVIREESESANFSSLMQTSHTRGTPIYSSPELLYNPFTVEATEMVAKPSRKSDIYAFAILAWELLTEKRPFPLAVNDIMLASSIHQGQRPPLKEIPIDCPKKVIELIESCWQLERTKRKSAVNCFTVFEYHYGVLSKSLYDIYLSHDDDIVSLSIGSMISFKLSQLGLRVCFSQQGTIEDSNVTMDQEKESIIKSKMVLVLASNSYQSNRHCIEQLKIARNCKPVPPIVPLFMEPDFLSWSSQDFTYLCQLKSPTLISFDLSDIAQNPAWSTDEDPSAESVQRFDYMLNKLSQFVIHVKATQDDELRLRESSVVLKISPL